MNAEQRLSIKAIALCFRFEQQKKNQCGYLCFQNQVIFTPPPVNGLLIDKKISAQVDCFFNATAQASNYFSVVNGSTPQNIQLKVGLFQAVSKT
jgi:hypothetical protein